MFNQSIIKICGCLSPIWLGCSRDFIFVITIDYFHTDKTVAIEPTTTRGIDTVFPADSRFINAEVLYLRCFKSLLEPELTICKLRPDKQTSGIWSKHVSFRKVWFKIPLVKYQPFLCMPDCFDLPKAYPWPYCFGPKTRIDAPRPIKETLVLTISGECLSHCKLSAWEHHAKLINVYVSLARKALLLS